MDPRSCPCCAVPWLPCSCCHGLLPDDRRQPSLLSWTGESNGSLRSASGLQAHHRPFVSTSPVTSASAPCQLGPIVLRVLEKPIVPYMAYMHIRMQYSIYALSLPWVRTEQQQRMSRSNFATPGHLAFERWDTTWATQSRSDWAVRGCSLAKYICIRASQASFERERLAHVALSWRFTPLPSTHAYTQIT
ncbi:hypothetical protein GGR52DRAFT_250721 [Hypoxylon sp. FL1284]|nr:hypothetical protein GGR52DRAFT_250721 [Hypoxylon sp. FL1284]